jgi:hypothetical protein
MHDNYFVFSDIPGHVVDVSCLNVREQNRHGPYRVCILHQPNEKTQGGSKITLFELSKEMVPGILNNCFQFQPYRSILPEC